MLRPAEAKRAIDIDHVGDGQRVFDIAHEAEGGNRPAGKVGVFNGKRQLAHPDYEMIPDGSDVDSAVEDQRDHRVDAEVPLTRQGAGTAVAGRGYVKTISYTL